MAIEVPASIPVTEHVSKFVTREDSVDDDTGGEGGDTLPMTTAGKTWDNALTWDNSLTWTN